METTSIMLNIRRSVTHAAFWGYCARLQNLGLQFIGMIVLSRILSPEDFGAMGIIGFFLTIGLIVSNFGFGGSILRQKAPEPEDWSTVFYINSVIGIFFALILFLVAPRIGEFYERNELINMLRVSSLSIILGALSTTRWLYLQYFLQQKKMLKIDLIANVCGILSALYIALYGWGVWALVMQYLVHTSLRFAILFWIAPVMPGRGFSTKAFHKLFSFSSKVFFAAVINVVFERFYGLLIGKLYLFKELGYYERAEKLESVATGSVVGVLSNILLPIFGSSQHDLVELKKIFKKFLIGSSTFLMFISIILYTAGEPLLLLCFGPQWQSVFPLLKIMVVAGFLMPMHVLNVQLMLTLNKSNWFLYAEIAKKLIYIIALLVTYKHGVIVIAVGTIGISIACAIINSYFGYRLIKYGFIGQIIDLLPIIIAGIAAIVSINLLLSLLPCEMILVQILFAITLTIVGYGGIICLLYRVNPIAFSKHYLLLLWNEEVHFGK